MSVGETGGVFMRHVCNVSCVTLCFSRKMVTIALSCARECLRMMGLSANTKVDTALGNALRRLD